ncbi:hypothetical protein [Allosphingosinicella indica]|uniref:Uncharacterized protein n=1 Tax=Allosphingosinicella indica TaxID=941907 RepID=A0A1X7FZ94_9SPHN|nr:hypothetical protein [Allosphingosinicella indica]SMF61425.1 hypothetical protein SAMN06295910_0413 [Allosphingosinicella indica]
MFGKIIGGAVGKRIGARYGDGTKGLLIGALAPVVLRRAFGPLGLAIGGGYLAKKAYDAHKERERRRGAAPRA